jgi:serine phosphatase RsbU (regulator of sigma subunit)
MFEATLAGDARVSPATATADEPRFSRHHSGGVSELRATGMPLGLMPGMSYEEKEIVVERGQGVLFYSDGLVEAHDPQREMFGFPRLCALVSEHGSAAGSLVDRLLDELFGFGGEDWEQEDDSRW